jgi:hypothetical protein
MAKLDTMADSVATLATREVDCQSFVAKQMADTYDRVYTARPEKVLKTLKKRKSSSGDPVVVSVYEKPVGVFAKELLHRSFTEGVGDNDKGSEGSQATPTPQTDIVEKITHALDGMIRKRHKLYAEDFTNSVKATMQEFLDEIQELAPSEHEITDDSQAARLRLADIIDELRCNCSQLQELVPIVV